MGTASTKVPYTFIDVSSWFTLLRASHLSNSVALFKDSRRERHHASLVSPLVERHKSYKKMVPGRDKSDILN